MPVEQSQATAKPEERPKVAIATLPHRQEVKKFVEGKLVTVHNRSIKTVTYYFADGRMIQIHRGQSGEVPENVADIFERESKGLVSRTDGGPGAQDLASKYQDERVRAGKLQSQVESLQAQLDALTSGRK